MKLQKYTYDKNNLVYVKANIFSPLSFLLGVMVIGSVAFCIPREKEIQIVHGEVEITIARDTTEQDVFTLIDKYPFKFPDIVKAQARLESSNFKSEVFKHNNNPFGMKMPGQRITTAKHVNLKHASYASLEEAIVDRLLYESKYMYNLNREQYYSFLDRLYAEGDNYSKKLKEFK